MPVLRGSAVISGGWNRGTGNLFVAAAPALALLCAALVTPRAAFAQIPPGCAEICGVSCVKPIAIPDRWDDVTPIAGYNGEIGAGGKQRPEWANNAKWDSESFTDLNGNGLYDPGEPFNDGNNNGHYDAETYDPIMTGFYAAGNQLAPAGDLARELTIQYASSTGAPTPLTFLPIDLPPLNRGTPITGSNAFLYNWENCNQSQVWPSDLLQLEPGAMVGPTNQAMRELISQDPNAYWDPVTNTVQGSAFAQSPRVIYLTAYDPRIPVFSGRNMVQVRKLLPFFMEFMSGNAAVMGRFLSIANVGEPCATGTAGGFFYECVTPATRTTWGQIKATYR